MYCPNCGADVQGRFCAKCGTAVDTASASGEPASEAPPRAQSYSAPPATAGGLTENVAAALCYVLGLITGILFLVLAPYNQNKFVRFHAFQAIFFHVAFIVLYIIDTVLAFILPWYLMSMIWLLLSLAGLVLWIFLMVKAYQHEKFKLPIIGDLAEQQA
jgi:uncharacterized membrane protein